MLGVVAPRSASWGEDRQGGDHGKTRHAEQQQWQETWRQQQQQRTLWHTQHYSTADIYDHTITISHMELTSTQPETAALAMCQQGTTNYRPSMHCSWGQQLAYYSCYKCC